MKKLLIITVLMFISGMIFANTQTSVDKKIVVNESDLTVTQLEKIASDAEIATLQKKVDTYGKWVGVGGEIGVAVKEGLGAVVDVADKFGKTDVGKFTLIMIAYKIVGKDIMRVIFGLLIFIIFTIYMYRHYKNSFMIRRVLIKSNGIKFWLPKEYQVIEPRKDYDGYEMLRYLSIIFLFAGYGIIYAIMFQQA